MQIIHKMCFDCVIDMEHEMTKAGTYEEYSKNKIRENALAWLAAAERDVDMLKQTYTQAAEFVTNSDGALETWNAKMTPAEFEETVQTQFNKFKENFLKNLDGEPNETN
jgi:hemerythrin-like domain-containing protein